MEKQFCFDYEHYAALSELSEADRRLVAEAERATANAHAPYSNFHVGAAARLRSGKILYGSNFESEVYPAGLCAERSLMFYAQANYADDPIETMAIASNPSERECYPCGQCRQVMVDVERRQRFPDADASMSGRGTVPRRSIRPSKLLPFTFILSIAPTMFTPGRHSLRRQPPADRQQTLRRPGAARSVGRERPRGPDQGLHQTARRQTRRGVPRRGAPHRPSR